MKTHTDQLLVEAIDQQQMQDALRALSFMRKIDFTNVPALNAVVKKVLDDLNDDLARGKQGTIKRAADVVGRAFQALRTRSTAPLQTPIGRAFDTAAAITTGFSSMPDIIDANVADVADAADKTLTDAVVGKADAVQRLIQQAFTSNSKAFAPAEVADEIMHLKLSAIADLVKRVKTSVGQRDVISLLAKQIKAQQTGAKPAEPAKAERETKRSEPTQQTQGNQTSKTTGKTTADDIQAALPKIFRDSKLNRQQFKSTIDAIARNGYKLVKKETAA